MSISYEALSIADLFAIKEVCISKRLNNKHQMEQTFPFRGMLTEKEKSSIKEDDRFWGETLMKINYLITKKIKNISWEGLE